MRIAPALTLLLMPCFAAAQTETRAVKGDAVSEIHAFIATRRAPAWFGYAVAAQPGNHDSCCWNENYSGCRLEGGTGNFKSVGTTGTIHLEGPSREFVLYRVQDHAVGKIRAISENCAIDAGGVPYIWFSGVSMQASLALLSEQATRTDERHEADAALAAIAMHAGDPADQVLKRFGMAAQPEWLREKALFWLASARGEQGFAVVREVARHDASDRVREKTMFHLSLVKDPAATDELIHSAKSDAAPAVRKQALFWLAQRAGARVAGTIGESLRNDPDTDVKKSAVFALQQLPDGEGVPLLIDVARTNGNPEVRKQAVFWLGQSHDPRALDFFEQVLAR